MLGIPPTRHHSPRIPTFSPRQSPSSRLQGQAGVPDLPDPSEEGEQEEAGAKGCDVRQACQAGCESLEVPEGVEEYGGGEGWEEVWEFEGVSFF